MNDFTYMKTALELAKKGCGYTSPIESPNTIW